MSHKPCKGDPMFGGETYTAVALTDKGCHSKIGEMFRLEPHGNGIEMIVAPDSEWKPPHGNQPILLEDGTGHIGQRKFTFRVRIHGDVHKMSLEENEHDSDALIVGWLGKVTSDGLDRADEVLHGGAVHYR